MISIDTNILVRFFTQDDKKQTEKAIHILSVRCDENNPGFITSIVLVELVWTLRSNYHFTKQQIVDILEILLNAKELCFEYPDATRYAHNLYANSSVDFADALIATISTTHGCETTVTFDTRDSKLDEFSEG